MRFRPIFASLAALISLTGAAQAAIFASPPVYGGTRSANGGGITCRLFNAGTSPVTVTARQIFTNTNVAITLTSDSCNVALGANKYCAFGGDTSGNFAYSCRAVVTGTQINGVRGVGEIQYYNTATSKLEILTVLPMTK